MNEMRSFGAGACLGDRRPENRERHECVTSGTGSGGELGRMAIYHGDRKGLTLTHLIQIPLARYFSGQSTTCIQSHITVCSRDDYTHQPETATASRVSGAHHTRALHQHYDAPGIFKHRVLNNTLWFFPETVLRVASWLFLTGGCEGEHALEVLRDD